MEKAVRLTADQRANLVAYLDGELDEAPTQEIDQILARSEVARHEVEALSRAWEMLDILPQSKASTEFTERTMSTLQLKEVPHSFGDQPWFTHFRRGSIAAVWTAALAGSLAIGYLATSEWYPNPHRQLLEELPVVRHLDDYQEVESIQFLQQLQGSGLFDGVDHASPLE
jgi:anti-sigma factor RsiW